MKPTRSLTSCHVSSWMKQDNAKAIEASLAENIARLPMDEIDQYKAFAALVKEGNSARRYC